MKKNKAASMQEMTDNPLKDRVGRQQLVAAIKRSGIVEAGEKINFLTLPAGGCFDVKLLNRTFGEHNVYAVGFEKQADIARIGMRNAPLNMDYRHDPTGRKFMREALVNHRHYSVIDFEFCGPYGSPNHVEIDTVVKLAKAKIETGQRAVIGITIDVSCGHFSKEKTLAALDVKQSLDSELFPVIWALDEYLGEHRQTLTNIGWNNPKCKGAILTALQDKKAQSLAVAQVFCNRLFAEMFAAIKPDATGHVPFTITRACYKGHKGMMMLRVMVVLNGTRSMTKHEINDHQFFPVVAFKFPAKLQQECLTNALLWYNGGTMPDSIKGDTAFYDRCHALFGMTTQQVAAWHTTNYGKWRKNRA